MKTTIEIADDLLERSKSLAQKRHTTLRAVIEEGLHRVLEDQAKLHQAFQLRPIATQGGGFQPGFETAGWDKIGEVVYEGHGG